MKRKKIMLLVVLLMAVGFAAVSTTLYINGQTKINANQEDFNVIFTKAILDGEDKSSSVISEDGTTITYSTNDLMSLGQKSILDFTVKNNSKQYDASVKIKCEPEGENVNIYYSITPIFVEIVVAQTEEVGQIVVELLKTSTKDFSETFKCTIDAIAVERDSIAKERVSVVAIDENDRDLNAMSYIISGDEANNLLTDLLDEGYITSLSDVNMLISVETDEFDNIAYTTFDVSKIANAGDKIAIFHYNEESSTWEYVATSIVDEDGRITSEFSSFSPVAFVNVDDNTNISTHVKHIDNDDDLNCDICGKVGKIVNVYHTHNSECEKTCQVTKNYSNSFVESETGRVLQYFYEKHKGCGIAERSWTDNYSGITGSHNSTHTYYTCGKTNTTIESTYVSFE